MAKLLSRVKRRKLKIPALTRSEMMARIRSKNTRPEIAVRRLLYALGYRFRINRKDLPGKPDVVIPRLKLAIFVHGCFWHQHQHCRLASMPKTRREYWLPKLANNVVRDSERSEQLREMGWTVAVIWECTTRNPEQLQEAVEQLVNNGCSASLLK